jgi:hypothetical protein
MAKGQFLSSTQKKIVNRFYEHADTRHITALQEALSELFLASDDKAKAKLWAKCGDLLAKLKIDPAKIDRAVTHKNLEVLGQLVTELTKRK